MVEAVEDEKTANEPIRQQFDEGADVHHGAGSRDRWRRFQAASMCRYYGQLRESRRIRSHQWNEVGRRRIPSDLAQKDYNLRSEIMRARQDVQDLGYELHTWEMPSA